MGCLEDQMKLMSGDITASCFSHESPKDFDEHSGGLLFSGRALDKNVPSMLELMRTLILETDFSGPEAQNVVRQELLSKVSRPLADVQASGCDYAIRAAAAYLSHGNLLREECFGLSHLATPNALFNATETSQPQIQYVMQKLRLIQSFATSDSSRLRVQLICEPGQTSGNLNSLQRWLLTLPRSGDIPSSNEVLHPLSPKVYWNMPSPVGWSASVSKTVPFVHETSAPLAVLSPLLGTHYISPEVCGQGGAYRAGTTNSGLSGLFLMMLNCDLSPLRSAELYFRAGSFAENRKWTKTELDEAKLAVLSRLDSPISVSDECERLFTMGITYEMEQRWRQQIFEVTSRQVGEAANKYLFSKSVPQAIHILGDAKDLAREDGWEIRELMYKSLKERSAGWLRWLAEGAFMGELFKNIPMMAALHWYRPQNKLQH